MDNTITALKNLYVALGGDADDVADIVIIPDMINAIADLVTSGATKELPAVTAEDNGKVLKVAEGAWAVGTDATE
jgi:dTDP-D-glucose 4,6-dehydratase